MTSEPPMVSSTSPLRNLQIIGSRRMGGAENSFVRLVLALSLAGAPADALTRENSAVYRALDGHERRHQAPMRNFLDLGSMLQIRRLLRDERYPVVQTWATRATWLTRAPAGTVHVARLGGYYRLRNFRHADAWVVNTRGLRDWMIGGGFPPRRVTWIDNFVPVDERPAPFTRVDLGMPADAIVSIALGRFVPKKGFADLLAAMALLPDSVGGRPHHLVLMGDGAMRETLERQALTLGIRDRVHFTGWVDASVPALGIGDVMVCPSRAEPLGNVILEAWSRGLPVLSTRTAGGRELIDDGATGLLCDVADPADLAGQWRRLLSDGTLRADLGGRAREHFGARYSEAATVSAYHELYERLTRSSAATQSRRTSR